jgi:hypothetical protein
MDFELVTYKVFEGVIVESFERGTPLYKFLRSHYVYFHWQLEGWHANNPYFTKLDIPLGKSTSI